MKRQYKGRPCGYTHIIIQTTIGWPRSPRQVKWSKQKDEEYNFYSVGVTRIEVQVTWKDWGGV